MSPAATVPDDVLVQRVPEGMVLLHLVSGRYYGLDEIGARMLDLACTLPDARSVVDGVVAEYDATPGVVAADLDRLMAQLADGGLVVWSGGSATDTVGSAGVGEADVRASADAPPIGGHVPVSGADGRTD